LDNPANGAYEHAPARHEVPAALQSMQQAL
jgi:hypothetical protein